MSHGKPHHRQRGFSLIELMVSIVIGMFSVVVILQVLASTATSRRIAVGGGDAQLNSVAALRALSLDVEHAGLGLQSFNISGCTLGYTTTSDLVAVTLPALAPVIVNPATSVIPSGDTNTDTLLVSTGNSGGPSEGDVITSATTTTAYVVTTPDSFFIGDQVVAAPAARAATCALQAAKVTGFNGFSLTVTGGATGLPSGSIAFNLGGAPSVRAYAIRNGDLVVCDYLLYNCGLATYASTYASTGSSPAWIPVASNIVSMRVQYARDSSGITGTTSVMDGVVDTYDQTTPGAATIPVYCAWARVIGVRLALVARSQQFDKTTPTTSAPVWDGSLKPDGTADLPLTLSGFSAWQNYRYTTVQTMIPIRNAIWQGGQPTYQGGAGAC
jgi:type IV pilus assembly protein PilW